jgi:head-tail joining protein
VGGLVSVTVVIGDLRQVAQLWTPAAAVPDGDGGYTQTYAPLDPAEWRCAIEVASVRAAERHFAATVTAHASYILSGRYHPGITTQTRIVWVDRSGETHTANVLDVDDTEGAGVETVALVSEVVDSTTAAGTSWMEPGWAE